MEEKIIELLKRQEQVLTEMVNNLIKELREVKKAIVMKTIEMKIKE